MLQSETASRLCVARDWLSTSVSKKENEWILNIYSIYVRKVDSALSLPEGR